MLRRTADAFDAAERGAPLADGESPLTPKDEDHRKSIVQAVNCRFFIFSFPFLILLSLYLPIPNSIFRFPILFLFHCFLISLLAGILVNDDRDPEEAKKAVSIIVNDDIGPADEHVSLFLYFARFYNILSLILIA